MSVRVRGDGRIGSAAPLSRERLAHAIIDALERIGTAQDYYRLNHVTRADIDRLAGLVAGWCREVGVEVETQEQEARLTGSGRIGGGSDRQG